MHIDVHIHASMQEYMWYTCTWIHIHITGIHVICMHIHAYMHMHITLWEGTCNLFFGASLMIICMIDKMSDNFMYVKCMISHTLGFWRIWLWLIWINTTDIYLYYLYIYMIYIYIYIYIYLLLCYLLDAIKSRYTWFTSIVDSRVSCISRQLNYWCKIFLTQGIIMQRHQKRTWK